MKLLAFCREAMLWLLLAPYAVGFLGAVSNQAVLIANHGKFPVMMNSQWLSAATPDADGMIDDIHCIMTSETHLNFLADVFNVRTSILSVGDLLLVAGKYTSAPVACFWAGLVIGKLRDE